MKKTDIIQINRKDSPGIVLHNAAKELEKIGVEYNVIEAGEDQAKVEFFIEINNEEEKIKW